MDTGHLMQSAGRRVTQALVDWPIRHKLTFLMMLTSGAALLLAVTAFVVFDRRSLRQAEAARLETLARIVGHSSATALMFRDRPTAYAMLESLNREPEIVAAAFYDAQRQPFVKFHRAETLQAGVPPVSPEAGFRYLNGHLELTTEIRDGERVAGWLFLRSNLASLQERMEWYGWIVFGVLLGAALLALGLSRRLHPVVSRPITALADVAQRITDQQDFSLRMPPHGRDEIGRLIEAFNRMLAAIQERDAKLQEAKSNLERRVLERTAALERQLAIRRRAEQELEELLALQAATLESTTDGILVVNQNGRIVTYNQKFVTMWGVPAPVIATLDGDQVLAIALEKVQHPDQFLAKVRELYSQPDVESYDVIELRDGRIFERYSHPHRVGDRCEGRVWSFRDITERRAAERALRESEEKLRHAQKMDAIGRLAGGVAHDFNNILTVINGYADLLVRRAEPGCPNRRYLEEIHQAGERAASLTRQLLAFSRKQVLQPRLLNLNEVVTGMERMLRRLIGENIELQTHLDPELAATQADPGQIEQVILNLSVNARDAMPNGGRLRIVTANVIVGDSHEHLEPGAYVALSVMDNGIGMPPEVQAHLFEPFFTTKGLGKGTGLGLATCYGIIKQSGGDIRVISRPGQGTAVNVYLPQVHTDARVVSGAPPAPELPKGKETVLLVEDEPALRELAGCVLRDCGYTVLEAANGCEALQLFARADTPTIQLLVTDVIMPQMGGKELANRIRAVRPDCRVLFTSGYTDDALVQYGVASDGFAFLEKPFSPVGLAQKVRAVLDQPSRN